MDYIVYSYGGAEILWKILNSLAMLANSSYFYRLSTLMTAGALLVVAARAIPAASIPFLFKKWILPTFFLMAFFWGPKVTVNIVDHVDTNFKAATVDNVPFGVAFAASLSTRMSDALTAVIEKYMTTSDMQRYSQVGPMFGARLMFEARTLTIRDPIMRDNLKDFTRQCYAWPYVFTNIAPGKKAAMESEDMLGFIEANAHKSLGMYWRNSNGATQFMFCKECAAMVREVIPLEIEMGFQSLAKRLFGGTEDGAAETRRLKQYFGDAWQFLAKGSSDAANVIQQELMLNAYRAALQDKREEFGLGRNPALSYLNAERGQIQQDESSLVKFALFGTQIPMLHSIFMAIALMFFVIVAPFTFTTGGIHLIKTFAKVMLWLAIWPPLSSILNVLGHMYLAKASAGQLMGYGEGLNLMTQSGLADTAYHAYTFVMGLQLSIPAVSWALLSGGGGYAMSQLASNLTQPSESHAAKAGSEIVDGNVSFDSQTIHHKSVANKSIAQQQLAPNINSGSRIDDGSFATTWGRTKDGELDRNAVTQQHLTQVRTNQTANDGVSALWQAQSNRSFRSAADQSKSAAEQVQMGNNKLFSVMKNLSTNEGWTETFGKTGNAGIQRSISECVDQAEQYAKAHNISVGSALNAMLNASVNAGVNFNLPGGGKAPGGAGAGGLLGSATTTAGAKASLGGQYRVETTDTDSSSKTLSSSELEKFALNFSAGVNFLDDKKGSLGDSVTKGNLDQVQDHYNKGETFGKQAAASYQEALTFNEAVQIQRQTNASSTTNTNDEVLDGQFGGDVGSFTNAVFNTPNDFKKAVSSTLDVAQSSMTPKGLGSEAKVKQHHKDAKKTIEDAPTSNPAIDQAKADSGFDSRVQGVEEKVAAQQKEVKLGKDVVQLKMNSQQQKIVSEQERQKNDHSEEVDSWAPIRLVNKALKGLPK